MLKKIVSSISIFSLLSFGTLSATQAADKPASWLPVTADGVRGSAPSANTINAKGKDTKISKKKCKKNTGKTLGAIAGGLWGASRGNSTGSKIAGAASGAAVGAAAGTALDGC